MQVIPILQNTNREQHFKDCPLRPGRLRQSPLPGLCHVPAGRPDRATAPTTPSVPRCPPGGAESRGAAAGRPRGTLGVGVGRWRLRSIGGAARRCGSLRQRGSHRRPQPAARSPEPPSRSAQRPRHGERRRGAAGGNGGGGRGRLPARRGREGPAGAPRPGPA